MHGSHTPSFNRGRPHTRCVMCDKTSVLFTQFQLDCQDRRIINVESTAHSTLMIQKEGPGVQIARVCLKDNYSIPLERGAADKHGPSCHEKHRKQSSRPARTAEEAGRSNCPAHCARWGKLAPIRARWGKFCRLYNRVSTPTRETNQPHEDCVVVVYCIS